MRTVNNLEKKNWAFFAHENNFKKPALDYGSFQNYQNCHFWPSKCRPVANWGEGQFLAEQLTLSQLRGQIMPTTVLSAFTDFQTLRLPWLLTSDNYLKTAWWLPNEQTWAVEKLFVFTAWLKFSFWMGLFYLLNSASKFTWLRFCSCQSLPTELFYLFITQILFLLAL